jgi:hypothetical protein
VPANMRVAGRVVSGRLQEDIDDDIFQAAANEAALLAPLDNTGQYRESGWVGPAIMRNNMNQYFPALSGTGNRANSQQQEVYIFIYIHIHKYIYIYIDKYTYMYIYRYLYIHIYVYMYIYVFK